MKAWRLLWTFFSEQMKHKLWTSSLSFLLSFPLVMFLSLC
uniref:Uncharacterized protein n=1 Tax=Rhizophora mucronata TaxID=61149 RepID=A0A2P2PCQ2_RHIMU